MEEDPEDHGDATLKETVRIRHVIVGILLYVKITQCESGRTFGEKCVFKHDEVDSQPNKKVEEKW